MIINAFSVLDAFVVLLRLLVAVLILVVGASALRHVANARRDTPDVHDRYYLLFSLAALLLALSVASWPLFYLMLQSYVDTWPGVMCVYGVTRIGTGSEGPSRFLPGLVTALEAAKPLLVFLSGAWFVLHWVNRRTATAPLLGRVLAGLMLFAAVALVDAALEAAYLLIPKKEDFLSVGCCTEAFDSMERYSRLLPRSLLGEEYTSWLLWTWLTLNLGLSAALFHRARQTKPGCRGMLSLLLAGAVLALPMNAMFLVEIAAPRLLRLPFHHCPYDLPMRAPESLVAIGLFFLGCFCVGWAWVAGWLGRHAEAAAGHDELLRRLLALAGVGYLGSTVMMLVELLLAG